MNPFRVEVTEKDIAELKSRKIKAHFGHESIAAIICWSPFKLETHTLKKIKLAVNVGAFPFGQSKKGFKMVNNDTNCRYCEKCEQEIQSTTKPNLDNFDPKSNVILQMLLSTVVSVCN